MDRIQKVSLKFVRAKRDMEFSAAGERYASQIAISLAGLHLHRTNQKYWQDLSINTEALQRELGYLT